jgi:hypothetical protein
LDFVKYKPQIVKEIIEVIKFRMLPDSIFPAEIIPERTTMVNIISDKRKSKLKL